MAATGDEKKLKLYSYWRSSCAHRVRIALNLKGIKYEYIPVNLLKGEHHSPEFLKLNPMGYVPALVDGDVVVSDSFAIIMYLEEKYPEHSVLPRDLQKEATNYQVANIVSSSIQPHQNGAGLKYVEEKIGVEEKEAWPKYHIDRGFAAPEKLLVNYAGKYATGDEVFLADLFLAPQLYGAITIFKVEMGRYPTLARLYEAYNELQAFQDAAPENQPDASPNS